MIVAVESGCGQLIGAVAETGGANLRKERVLLANLTGTSASQASAADHRMSPVR